MRIIQVLHNFGGDITNDQRILPGTYPEDDKRLFGVTDYLIEHGHAVVVGTIDAPVTPAPAVAQHVTPDADADDDSAAGEETPPEDTSPEDTSPEKPLKRKPAQPKTE